MHVGSGTQGTIRAFAYVVAPDTGSAAVLRDMARQVGCSGVQEFRTAEAAEQQATLVPLIYFLVAAVPRPFALKPVVQAIRTSSELRIRFAPLIYFADSPSIETIKSCIAIGFDDVITLPFTLGRVAERLERQVDRPFVYYETATYFGPDRRGRMADEEGHSLRGTGGAHRRFEIMRSPATGIQVVERSDHLALV